MAAPPEVEKLVERFASHRESYQSSGYNETQLRREFLDPFFKALGWDVDNEQGHAEAYKDVIHEDAIKIGGATKAPDYCFRIGGRRIFFLEAKKPSVNVGQDVSAAYQLRRYAWSAKLPLSILSDFEELAVYDCRVRPGKNDKPTVARTLYFTFDQYVERWDELASIFSPEAIQRGSFDKYAESKKLKRGTAEVDTAFLDEIESWRLALARNLALRNPKLDQRELNFAVQRTIDRIIFLRMCEDRGIERYGKLQALANDDRIYPRMCELFDRADERYNSGLFHFQVEKGRAAAPDELTLTLKLDDKVLKEMLRGLYYPDSPYEFSVLPAEILGQVYEQFLGKVIRLTKGHQAKVEEKPEVRKAGGVYYTPAYIVQYIVKNTVGKLVDGKTPKQVAKLRVLDPACGSGSFLVGALQFLLDWHRDYYVDHGPGKHKQIYQGRGGQWFLTAAEKKRILLNNIYGVDIDSQAVEVTKLSLLLKVLEDENRETIERQLRLLHERALPDLGHNIKCGNSLIGPDFYDGRQLSLLDDEEQYRINAFDWKTEFPEIFKGKKPGFDAVIGNPPYIRNQAIRDSHRRYYEQSYSAATATYDVFALFVERGLHLLQSSGRFGMIVPNKFFTTDYGAGLRHIVANRRVIERIVDFEYGQVFLGAGTYTCLLFLNNAGGANVEYARLGRVFDQGGAAAIAQTLSDNSIEFERLAIPQDGSRWVLAIGPLGAILSRLQEKWPLFGSLHPHVFQGLKTSADKIYMVTVASATRDVVRATNLLGEDVSIEAEMLEPVVKGEHVRRYVIDKTANLRILYPYVRHDDGRAVLMDVDRLTKEFPNTWRYLNKHRELLQSRDRGAWRTRPNWYAYGRPQNIGAFMGPKYLLPYMTKRLRTAWDESGGLFFVNITTGGYGLRVSLPHHDPLYLLGIINSRLLDIAIRQMTNRFRGGYMAVNKQAIERLPIRLLDSKKTADRDRHDRMVALVQQILSLHERLSQKKTAHDKTLIQRQIDTTDRQIDQLVYELYGLTDKEIALVEEATER